MPSRSLANKTLGFPLRVDFEVSARANANMRLDVVDAIFTPFLIGMNDRLRVTVRTENVSTGFERAPKLAEVINLAVEHDHHSAVLVEDRLISPSDINNAKPAHAERNRVIDEHALVIRPAMMHLPQHLLDDCLGRFRLSMTNDTTNSTHGFMLISVRTRGQSQSIACENQKS